MSGFDWPWSDWNAEEGALWATALVTFLGFVAATFAGVVAYRLYQAESARDKLVANANRQAQAALVAAWIAEGTKGASAGQRVLMVRNASELPVRQAQFRLACGNDVCPASMSLLPPGRKAIEVPTGLAVAQFLNDKDNAGRYINRGIALTTTFADAAGVWWERDTYGQLFEKRSPSA
jgi:hypothetical protein